MQGMDKDTLLQSMRDAHATLAGLVDALSDAALDAPAPGMDGWTRKDVLHHIAWWHNHAAGVVDALCAGRVPYDATSWDIDGWNARTLAEGRAMTALAARNEEAKSFVRFVAAVESASSAQLFEAGHFPWMDGRVLADKVEGNSFGHYPEHLPHLA
jgi:hypothetical protein